MPYELYKIGAEWRKHFIIKIHKLPAQKISCRMKKIFLLVALTSLASLSAQQHFAGISTSSRTSIVNGVLNPAEFANITSKYEISVFAPSVSVSNNKVRISDLMSGDDFDQLIFSGNAPANFRVDGEILGPGISYKYDKWALH
jgi:hypothetical protein